MMIAPHERFATQASALALAFACGPAQKALIRFSPSPQLRLAPRFRVSRRTRFAFDREAGTTTAEYAIGTLAACAFAAVLYKILTGGSVAAALGGLIHRALGIAG